MNNSEIIKKAKILAEAITQSSELAELHRCEEAMKADDSAQQLIAELQLAYEKFMEDQKSGGLADKTKVVEIETKMDLNPTIVAYKTAQDRLEEMLQGVDTIITSAIAGSSCQDNTSDPELMRSQAGVMTEDELQKLVSDYLP